MVMCELWSTSDEKSYRFTGYLVIKGIQNGYV